NGRYAGAAPDAIESRSNSARRSRSGVRWMRRTVVTRRGLTGKEAETVDHHVVDVAIRPILFGLERLDRRVLRPLEMLGRMVIRGRVAAADVSAGHAEPQVDPFAAGFQAFLASRAGGLDRRATRLA